MYTEEEEGIELYDSLDGLGEISHSFDEE